MTILIELVLLIITLVLVLIAYFKWRFTFWQKAGVPTTDSPPTIPFGHAKNSFLGRQSIGEMFYDFYKEFKRKNLQHGGVYFGNRPFYVPLDTKIIKHIMQIDFVHFVNHGGFVDEDSDPLSANLFSLEDTKWKNMRIKLTPTFTSGKMKMMFQTLTECTVGLKEIMDDCAKNKEAVDIKDVLGRFTTDIIGSTAFGIECNTLKEPDSDFRRYGNMVFDPSWRDIFKVFCQLVIPRKILKIIKFKLTNPEVEKFFMKTVQDTVAYREKNNINRKDFMHLLIQLKNRGSVSDHDKITSDDGKIHGLTINQVAAQSFVFFVAGFETSSTLMTFALYELAIHPEIQEKLRNEIFSILAKYDNQLSYDAVMEMTYMDKILYETLRKYPPLPLLSRECSKDYKVPDTDVVIKKGTNVAISTLGLHNDPEYYPNPEIFDPERFTEKNKNSRPSFTWLPFGEGPRICIGLRFGLMQSKVGLTALLKNYRVTLSKKTPTPITLKKTSFILTSENKIYVDVEKLS